MNKLRHFARLSGIAMSFLTVSVPILGALTVGKELTLAEFIALGSIGLCAHIFGFALNDLMDLRFDRFLPIHQSHPLVTGAITIKEAWLFILFQIPIALGIYTLFLQGSRVGLALLCLSIPLSVAYNLWSKRGLVPRFFAELALALSVGLLCVVGALLKTSTLSATSILFAVTLTLILLLLNSVPNHLKDLQSDEARGAESFVISVGAKMLDSDKIFISRYLYVYSVFLQASIIGGIITLIVLFDSSWFIIIFVFLLGLYSSLHLRMLLSLQSFKLLRQSLPLLTGFYSYFALSLFLINRMPSAMQFFYSLAVFVLLALPWWLAVRVWRNRYQVMKTP